MTRGPDTPLILGFPEYREPARRLAAQTGLDYADVDIHTFPDGESRVRLPQQLPHQVFLCRSLDQPNRKLVELELAAAAANCLSASLMFCLAKEDVPAASVRTEATCTLVRNEKKRLRIGRIDVALQISEALSEAPKMKRCMSLFEDFCVVTDSIRKGIPIGIEVKDHTGEVIHRNDD